MEPEKPVFKTRCTRADLHPYECGGVTAGCVHCAHEMLREAPLEDEFIQPGLPFPKEEPQ